MNLETSWPAYLQSAYSGATVRLTTLLQKRKQSLLFGCVELFPHEVPLPTDALKPEPFKVRDATVLTTVSVMSVAQGLAWYESSLRGELTVPGINPVVPVDTLTLAPEPALGRLVLAKNLPFECRWHCGRNNPAHAPAVGFQPGPAAPLPTATSPKKSSWPPRSSRYPT